MSSLADWVSGKILRSATATAATDATDATVPGTEAPGVASVATVNVARSAIEIANNSGARLFDHEGRRIVVVPESADTPEFRGALARVGYASARIVHRDTAPYKGRRIPPEVIDQ